MSDSVNLAAASFADWAEAIRARTEAALSRFLPQAETEPARLHQAMRYACLGGGKRVRPQLAFAAGEISDAPPDRLARVACAVETIHIYSLVHDDLPCMDDDALRHGRPTCHVQFDEATALLVGDALQSLAFELLASSSLGARWPEMIRLLAHAAGSGGMAGGQAIDLSSVGLPLTLPQLEFMHAKKTGALIRAAVLLGAWCGNALSDPEMEALDRFAQRAGLLFQVVDDMLDYTASTETLGKTAGKDAASNKPTYVSMTGLSETRRLADRLYAEAADSLLPFAGRGKRLLDLAAFMARRTF